MQIIEKNHEKEAEYSEFMDSVACSIFSESLKGIQSLSSTGMDDSTIRENAGSIGLAVGQIVFDKVIELSKDMSREDLVRYLAQASAAHVVEHMNSIPAYRTKILIRSMLTDS